MPELPEMEHYKAMLSERIVGHTITDVIVGREKSINVSIDEFRNTLISHNITRIDRRAKFLLMRLEDGRTLLLHLMLGGSMYLGSDSDRPNRTVQVEIRFAGFSLFFIGLRLGYLHLLDPQPLQQTLAHLGPEPLDRNFDEHQWQTMLRGRKTQLKTLLMDQHWLAGIGSCYSDEICFSAGIIPFRKADTLHDLEQMTLLRSMRFVLLEAIGYGGYMGPLFRGDTRTGGYDERCMVYDREGERCLRCGSVIIRRDIGSRKSFHCPGCQH